MTLGRAVRQYLGVRAKNPPNVQLALINPTTQDDFIKGDIWLNTVLDTAFMWSGDTWIAMGSGATGGVVTVTADSGGPLSPAAGNINILGTANQITTAGAGSTVTFTLPAAIIAPGSIVATTSIASTTTMVAGTGFTVTTGGILVSGGDIINSHSNAATDVTIEVTNSDNTSGSSRAGVEIATGGASSGDPYLSFQISGVGASTMSMGLDNSASDLFVISNSTALGTSNALTLSQAGALTATTTVTAGTDLVSTAGNVLIQGAAKQLRVEGGAATDFIGTATLVAGEATVLNTNIAATDRIFVQRSAVNASTALGVFKVVKTAATNFVITACKPADATTETGDASTVEYFIVREL